MLADLSWTLESCSGSDKVRHISWTVVSVNLVYQNTKFVDDVFLDG